MSDYLQRLLSRHFGQGSAVVPNANRYFSRGAEMAAETAPAGFAELAEATVADTPTEKSVAAQPPVEEAPYPTVPERPPQAEPMRRDEAAPPHTERSPIRREEGLPARPEDAVARRPAGGSALPPAAATETTGATPARALRGEPARPATAMTGTQPSPETGKPPAMLRASPPSEPSRQRTAPVPRTTPAMPATRTTPATPTTPTTPAMREASGKPYVRAGSDPLLPSAKSPTQRSEGAMASTETMTVQSVEAAASPRVSAAPGALTMSGRLKPRRESQVADRRDAMPRPAAVASAFGAAVAAMHSAQAQHDALPGEASAYLVPQPTAVAPGAPFATRRGSDDVLQADAGNAVSDTPIVPLAPPPAPGEAAGAPAAPEITVTIGTVELHAAPLAPPPAPAAAAPRGPRLSLDEYLQRRGRRRE
jgi:hypothetical protein